MILQRPEKRDDYAKAGRAKLGETFADAYDDARHSAAIETGLHLATFPEVCPWTFEQAINPEFWPE
ncbi:MAG: DUF29 family protein [Candidatus Thiothrix moscowensis]|nr:DUF29 family protein [Candidatus Thiothrix moscowensis]